MSNKVEMSDYIIKVYPLSTMKKPPLGVFSWRIFRRVGFRIEIFIARGMTAYALLSNRA
jgi:hypothetical protein